MNRYASRDDDAETTATTRPSSKRPTKRIVNNLAMWATGGGLNQLPYTPQASGISDGATGTDGTVTTKASGFWSGFINNVARDLSFLRGEYADEVIGNVNAPAFPKEFILRLPPTPANKSRQSVDQVFIGDPQFTVELPHGFREDADGKTSKKRAELEKLFTQACYGWHNTEERNSDTSPSRNVKMNTIALGMGARMTVLDKSKYPEEPERKKGEKKAKWEERLAAWKTARIESGAGCFAVSSIHPMNIIYDRAHTPPQYVIIREPIDPYTAAMEYPDWEGADKYEAEPGTDQQSLVKARYWSPEWTGCWIDDQPAYGAADGFDEEGIAPNPYGFIPVWPSAGGHGHQDPSGRPEHELKGIIRDARDLFVLEAENFNLARIHARRTAYGPKSALLGGIPTDTQTADRIKKEMAAGPNVVPWLPNGWSWDNVDPSPIPQSLVMLSESVTQRIDDSTIYDVSAGAGTPTEPAARTRVRLQQIDKKLADAALHIEQALEADYTARFQMIKIFGKPVGVNVAQMGQPAKFVEVHPDDIPVGLVVKCRLIGDSEEEKARKQQQADARYNAPNPTLDLLGYLEMTGDPDPESTIKGLVKDFLFKNVELPLVAQVEQGQGPALVAQAMEMAGIQYTPEELAAASMRAQQQMMAEQGAMNGVSGSVGDMGAGAASAGGAADGTGGGQMDVNQQGAALPGTPYEPAQSGVSDNPQVSRPDSGEAYDQRGRLSQQLVAR